MFPAHTLMLRDVEQLLQGHRPDPRCVSSPTERRSECAGRPFVISSRDVIILLSQEKNPTGPDKSLGSCAQLVIEGARV